jgi:hypothetical protein
MNSHADAAIAAAANQAREDAPQIEVARAKQETADLEAARQANLKAFRPWSRFLAIAQHFRIRRTPMNVIPVKFE